MSRKDLIVSSIVTTALILGVAEAKDESKMINKSQVAKGTTIGKYQKPGAPVDIVYSSRRVGRDEVSDVNISLITAVKSGEMLVNIDIDKSLKREDSKPTDIRFQLNPTEREYKINLKVSSPKDGLYYIRVFTKMGGANGAKMRVFAVPVYVGSGKLKHKGKQKIMKSSNGENISISKAQESIKVLKD